MNSKQTHFTNKQIVWVTCEIYAKRSEAQFKRFDQQETRKITQSKRSADKLGFQPSKQGRQEVPGLSLQSIIIESTRLKRLENRHLVKPVLADEKTQTMKGRVSQVGHRKKCLRLSIQLT
ncbi:unnamed protein product [Porites evermanni]|uniref:Transposase n=1 Tax=Porites evermanni TaxID=104178 RepID=A0ABN8Q0T4_9CNID|nr:unnamed protein product [Porites evermanni]